MSNRLQRLLESQSVKINFSALSPDYMVLLNHMWNGRLNLAADHAASALAAENEETCSARFYRSWIEALYEMGEQDSLESIGQHLLALGRVEPELKQTYLALRGIIHLYLEEIPAARLVLRTAHNRENNPYFLEFEQMCARRGIEGADEFALLDSRVEISDWWHWNTLIADLAAFGHVDDLQSTVQYVSKNYPGSPAVDSVAMHRAMENGHFAGALAHAVKLHGEFPANQDYGFYAAFCAYHSGDRNKALDIISGLNSSGQSSDADVLHLHGEILAEIALETENESLGKQAAANLDRAARIYRRMGKPIDTAIRLLHALERGIFESRDQKFDANGFRAPRSWMVMLTPAQYANLSTSGDQDVATLQRPMGKHAMPGDVVLFVTKSAHVAKHPVTNAHELRIVAVYRVASRPYWHPTNRWQNQLELVDRPDSPIPIDSKEVKSDWNVRGAKYSLPRGHHARYSVYELDDSALDIVVAAVKRRSEGIEHSSERRGANLSQKDSV
jgi:hypothetical protein